MISEERVNMQFESKEQALSMLYILSMGLEHCTKYYGVNSLEGKVIYIAKFAREEIDKLEIPNTMEDGCYIGLSLEKIIVSGLISGVEDKIKLSK